MLYLFVKWIHIVAIISWMAGVLYLYRLLVNHKEAWDNGASKDVLTMLEGMESRLYKIITVPAMSVATICGFILLGLNPHLAKGGWFHIKFLCVVILIGATVAAARIMRRFPEAGESVPTSKRLRLYNEIPTILMLVIIAMVVFRPFTS